MRQFLADLMREARDLPVINLLGQRHSFELFEARHLLELTPKLHSFGLGVNVRLWRQFFMGADLVFHRAGGAAN